MQEAGFLGQNRRSPTALSLVVLAHAGALGALMLMKGPEIIDVIRTKVTMVEVEPPPPPDEPPPPQPEPAAELPPVAPPPTVRIDSTPTVDIRTTEIVRPRDPEPRPLPELVRPDPPAPRIYPPQRARASLSSYFSTDDYPAAALRAEAEGTTRFSLTIGTDGRVTNCTVTGSSGHSALDGATCRILRSRARYTPARDENRNPTTGTDRGSVTWRLPAD